MKKTIMETRIQGKHGSQMVITYGYKTKVPGLSVVRSVALDRAFCIIHAKSGLSLGIFFTAFTKAIGFANKYLINFDFNRSVKEIMSDYGIRKCLFDAKERNDKQDGICC